MEKRDIEVLGYKSTSEKELEDGKVYELSFKGTDGELTRERFYYIAKYKVFSKCKNIKLYTETKRVTDTSKQMVHIGGVNGYRLFSKCKGLKLYTEAEIVASTPEQNGYIGGNSDKASE